MKKNFLYAALIFFVSFAFHSCQKEISEETGKTDTPSAGSLKDSNGDCYPAIITGTYYTGIVPGSDTANVVIQVNVTTPGTYHIYTDMQNGFSFSDTGYFTSTGINLVTLRPSGTPILAVTTNFSVTYDTSICMFGINVQDSTGLGLGGNDTTGTGGGTDSTNLSDTAWKFSDDLGTYNGPASMVVLEDTLGLTSLAITGNNVAGDHGVVIHIILPSSDLSAAVGMSFSTANVAAIFEWADGTGVLYSADVTTPGFDVIFIITSYDAATKIVTGTFSGTAKDSSGNTVNITNGSFKVKVT